MSDDAYQSSAIHLGVVGGRGSGERLAPPGSGRPGRPVRGGRGGGRAESDPGAERRELSWTKRVRKKPDRNAGQKRRADAGRVSVRDVRGNHLISAQRKEGQDASG